MMKIDPNLFKELKNMIILIERLQDEAMLPENLIDKLETQKQKLLDIMDK